MAHEGTKVRRTPAYLLVVGLALDVLGLVVSDRWTVEYDGVYVIPVVGLSVLLVLIALSGRRWAVYVLVALSLIGAVAQAATLEPRRLIISALWIGEATAFIAYLARTRTTDQGTSPRS